MNTSNLALRSGLVVTLWLVLSSHALAYHHHQQFQDPADGSLETPGSGGLYYTGSKQDLGLRCSHCHLDAPGRIRADITFEPELGAGDSYVPGQLYAVEVAMTGEAAGLSGCKGDPVTPNRNGMVAMLSLASGAKAGALRSDAGENNCGAGSSTAGTTTVFGDCRAAVGVQLGNQSLDTWAFQWQAPAAGGGPVTLDMGVVDGNCVFDSYDDDVFETTLDIGELTAMRTPARGLWPRPAPIELPERSGMVAMVGEARRRSISHLG